MSVLKQSSHQSFTFVATAGNGTNRIMVSQDGINWKAQSEPTDTILCFSITKGNNRFVSVSPDTTTPTNKVMTGTCE
ncbi:hypothetical protein AB3N60_05235 [Leptospira sp. WS39.C2]